MVAPRRSFDRASERKLATILFADLVGSTALGEQIDPERLHALLESYFRAMAGIIESWGGTVEKYIGDAIMAVFGVPSVHEDDAPRAIGAAIEMLDRLTILNQEFRDRHGVELQIRIGINTGEVIAPVGGATAQMIVAGDAVNVAARLEQAADPGTILVGERTYVAAGDAFRFEAPRSLELKGKARPVTARMVLGRSAVRSERSDRLKSPMVGREREIRALSEALDDAIESGTPRLVLVFGPAGIGKSRLLREFLEAARTIHAELRVLRGHCLSAGHGISYWALGEIVREACGISLDDAPDVTNPQLQTCVTAIVAPVATSGRDVDDTLFALATSAGIHLPDNPLDQMRPAQVAFELARAWPRFATANAHGGPVILVVEDLHWADEQLLAMLEAILIRSSGPLLVLATARPEFAESHAGFAAAQEGYSSLSLKPLSENDGARLVSSLLSWDAIPDVLREALLDRAEGNPFFLEQLVGGLIDAGAIVRVGETWRLGDGVQLRAIPDTVQGVLSARIDRLPTDEKRVLQAAAVVGRAFWAPAVALSVDDDIVLPALAGLESKGLVLARPLSSVGGETEYAFKHALIHDVTYASIPMARRARSHALVGEWLEGLAGEAGEGLLELVAFHYRAALRSDGADLAWADDPAGRSSLRDRAFPVVLLAGAVARRRNAIERAVELHEVALQLAATADERARAYEELGDDHGWAYHGDPAVEAWDAALKLRQVGGDDEAIARICVKAARACAIYWGGFASRPSGARVDHYVDEGLARSNDPVTKTWLLALRGRAAEAWAGAGLPDPLGVGARLEAAEEAANLASREGESDVRVMALRSLGGLHLQAGETTRALQLAEEELAIVDRVAALRDRLLTVHLALSRIMDIGGDLERALTLARQALVQAREAPAHDHMHATYFVMAPLYRLGRWDDIEPIAMEHLAAFDEETVDMSCPFTRSGPVVGAIVLERLGRAEATRKAAERIVPNEKEPGLVEAWMAERAMRAGDGVAARDIAARTMELVRDSVLEPPYELPVLVEAIASLRDWQGLDAILPQARANASRIVWLAPAIERAQAMRLMADGNRTAARATFGRALQTYQRLGMVAEETATLQAMAGATHAEA